LEWLQLVIKHDWLLAFGESTMQQNLTQREAHFAFGKNWAAYAKKVTEAEISEAERGLRRLLGETKLSGKRFLDIGCGSGIHALAALRLGAREVIAVDLDPDSVATARAMLEQHAPKGAVFRVEEASVFDLGPDRMGAFDIVYSWGVLHHTGDMERSLRSAAAMVRPGGCFVFALYRRVWMDAFWRWEKRWYAHASPQAQRRARAIYVVLFRLRLWVTGRSFGRYVANYRSNRGMDFYRDVHDWMGGWPYESILPSEVDRKMRDLGFLPERVEARYGRLWGRSVGVFGSGCDEYVYARR
jgi:2-polyprenyl-6-hydroxyphenyl methylase/3-demethylubiquinone-9 3-methyltransferase